MNQVSEVSLFDFPLFLSVFAYTGSSRAHLVPCRGPKRSRICLAARFAHWGFHACAQIFRYRRWGQARPISHRMYVRCSTGKEGKRSRGETHGAEEGPIVRRGFCAHELTLTECSQLATQLPITRRVIKAQIRQYQSSRSCLMHGLITV